MRAHLVVGGKWHDFEFAQAQLSAALDAREVALTVHSEWPRDELDSGDVLVSYTCDLRPDEAAQRVLVDFVDGGGRWLALHATNSALDAPEAGGPRVFHTPRVLGEVAIVLGSQFLAHPPIAPYRVEITAPEHPLVVGLEPFETRDELYVSDLHGPLEVLLHTRFTGECPSFAEGHVTDDELRPVLYLRRYGAGEVVYLTLGHCRSLAQLHELGKPDATDDDRGSWELAPFRVVLSRCLDYALANSASGRESNSATDSR